MKAIVTILLIVITHFIIDAQTMTPRMLWELKRVSPVGISIDGSQLIYRTSVFNIEENSNSSNIFSVPIAGGKPISIEDFSQIVNNTNISPNKKYEIISKEVKVKNITGNDFYPDMDKSDVFIIDQLNYRHWDKMEDGLYGHLFIKDLSNPGAPIIDIMSDEPYDTPTQPFGGPEDYCWNNNATAVYYVCKKEYGIAYTRSTNTDIYKYDITKKTTTNLTQGNKGYDTHPLVSKSGLLAYLQMEVAGYEADKNDIILVQNGIKHNLTKHWDGTVNSFVWGNDEQTIYFIAPIGGTIQLFSLTGIAGKNPRINQITDGIFDVRSIVGQVGNKLIVTRTDMNHASEIYSANIDDGNMVQLTHENDKVYNSIKLSKVEKRVIKTTDNKDMVTWVIYPPDFVSSKKYPTLLYCQGGPQSPLSQFYSFRWNFQLMAANGYIIVAPNRRGMPGHGVEWNEQISGDWGGQNILDYLSAIDEVSKESYVDNTKLGAVGASYGGYSVFYLAGIHNKRFKSFIAHDGIFNMQSMIGTTEELFFVEKDFAGAYWDKPKPKAYTKFNPINKVKAWDTPILIIQGGKDYRVPIGQGLEAFQAAQMLGVKSKLLFFPEENHWILSAQNGIIWQKEYFKWLDETLKNINARN